MRFSVSFGNPEALNSASSKSGFIVSNTFEGYEADSFLSKSFHVIPLMTSIQCLKFCYVIGK